MDSTVEDDADAPRYPHRDRDAAWVEEARSGSDRAFGQLYDAWFDRVFDLTNRVVRDREVALEVTQDAFLSAWRNLGTLADAGAFGGWLLRIARNGALNRQQKERRSRPVDDQDFAVMEAGGGAPSGAPTGFALEDGLASATDPARALEDAETRELVWQAAAALGERDTEVLNLQLRHGLTPAEIGEVLGMNRNAANQLVHRVRGRFEVALRARLLWRNDQPACAELSRLLASAGVQNFSVEAVKIADKHAPGCPDCSERRKSRLAPAVMFGAIPLLAAPIAFKQQAAYALEQAGVPMGGSAFGSAGAGESGAPGDGGGSSGGATGGAGASGASTGRRFGTRAIAMAGAGVVIVIALLAVVTGRLADQPSNEVVALASGVPGSSLQRELLPGATTGDSTPGDTAAGDPTATDPTASDPGGVVDPPSSVPGGGPDVSFSTVPGATPSTNVGQPGPDPTAAPPPGPQPTTPNGPVDSIPGPTVTAPPEIKVSISMAPQAAARTYAMNGSGAGLPTTPTLTWSVSGGGITAIRVYAVNGTPWQRNTASGSERICPGTLAAGGAYCRVPGPYPGSYTYRIDVFGAGNALLARQDATLAVR